MLPIRTNKRTTSEYRGTQLLICEKLSLAIYQVKLADASGRVILYLSVIVRTKVLPNTLSSKKLSLDFSFNYFQLFFQSTANSLLTLLVWITTAEAPSKAEDNYDNDDDDDDDDYNDVSDDGDDLQHW